MAKNNNKRKFEDLIDNDSIDTDEDSLSLSDTDEDSLSDTDEIPGFKFIEMELQQPNINWECAELTISCFLQKNGVNIFSKIGIEKRNKFIEYFINSIPLEFSDRLEQSLRYLLHNFSYEPTGIMKDLFKETLSKKKYELAKFLILYRVPDKEFVNMIKNICDVLINYEIQLIEKYGDTKYPHNISKITDIERAEKENLSKIFQLFFSDEENIMEGLPIRMCAEIYNYLTTEEKYEILNKDVIFKTIDATTKFLVNRGGLPICMVPNILDYIVVRRTKSEIISPFFENQNNYFNHLLLRVDPSFIKIKEKNLDRIPYSDSRQKNRALFQPERAIYFASMINDKSYINKLLEEDKTVYSKYKDRDRYQNILTYAIDNNMESLVDFIYEKIDKIDLDINDIDFCNRSIMDFPIYNEKIREKLDEILAKKPTNLNIQREKRKEFIIRPIERPEDNKIMLPIIQKIGPAQSSEEVALFSNFLNKSIDCLSPEIFKILLENGAILDTSQRKYGENALHIARDNETFKLIFEIFSQENISVNTQELFGYTALHLAIIHDKYKIFKFLLSQGKCDLKLQDNQGDTVLHIASKSCALKNVKLLLKAGCDKMIKNHNDKTALDVVGEHKLDSEEDEERQEIISILTEDINISDFVKPDPTPNFYNNNNTKEKS